MVLLSSKPTIIVYEMLQTWTGQVRSALDPKDAGQHSARIRTGLGLNKQKMVRK